MIITYMDEGKKKMYNARIIRFYESYDGQGCLKAAVHIDFWNESKTAVIPTDNIISIEDNAG